MQTTSKIRKVIKQSHIRNFCLSCFLLCVKKLTRSRMFDGQVNLKTPKTRLFVHFLKAFGLKNRIFGVFRQLKHTEEYSFFEQIISFYTKLYWRGSLMLNFLYEAYTETHWEIVDYQNAQPTMQQWIYSGHTFFCRKY